MTATDYEIDQLTLDDFEDDPDLVAPEVEDVVLEPGTAAFVADLVAKVWMFVLALSGIDMYPYQEELGKRIIESLIINDGEEITGLISRQAGKSETLANTIAGLMVILPKIARMFPQYKDRDGKEILAKFKDGLWVGVFAPIELQADTLFSRIVSRLTSDTAVEVLTDDEIDDTPVAGGKIIRLKKSGSFCRMQTANPRAKVESKSYHLIVIDEAQGADEYMVRKSIHPMLAHYNGTIVKIGTPDTVKGDFYKAIQHNKRRHANGKRKNHFQFDWTHCARYNPNYRKFVTREKNRIGEDSDEFQLSYALKWLLDRGMFTTAGAMEDLGDKSMQIVPVYTSSPVVVGIDPARKIDSTVVTVVWVDWDRPDEFGFFDHRILNWLELHGDDWEEQYFKIVDFLSNYKVMAIGVDAGGVGDVVADRLRRLIPHAEVVAMGSQRPDQSQRWTHLMQLMQRGMVSWPAHAKTRRLKVWRRFYQQMIDLEKHYEGPHVLAMAPREAEAHDDYPDSLAIACMLTQQYIMPSVEVSESPFLSSRRR